jgi:hypothetical protein
MVGSTKFAGGGIGNRDFWFGEKSLRSNGCGLAPISLFVVAHAAGTHVTVMPAGAPLIRVSCEWVGAWNHPQLKG